MQMRCPHCGGLIDLPGTRNPMGMGTRPKDPLMPLNKNQEALFNLLESLDRRVTVRELQHELFERQIRRHGKDWNYYLIQIDLSILAGRRMIVMVKKKNVFSYAHPNVEARLIEGQIPYPEPETVTKENPIQVT